MAESLYFNCGELKPGLRRITLPRPPSPSTIIVNPFDPVDPPFIPGDPPVRPTKPRPDPRSDIPAVIPPKFKCETLRTIYCPEDLNLPLNQRRIARQDKACTPCVFDPSIPGFPGDCTYSTNNCDNQCLSTSGPCGQTTIPVTGPTTGARPKWKCINYRTIYCPEDFNKPVGERRIKVLEKRCVACSRLPNGTFPPECTFNDPNCGNQCNSVSGNCDLPQSTGGPTTTTTATTTTGPRVERRWQCLTYNQVPCPTNLGIINYTLQRCFECTPNANGQFPETCVHTSEAACIQSCPREIFVAECPPSQSTSTGSVGLPGTTSTGGSTGTTGTRGEEPQSTPIVTIKPDGSVNTNNQTQVTVGSTVIAPPNVGVEIPRNNEVNTIDLNSLENERRLSQSFANTIIPNSDSSSIYHLDYNFYQKEPTLETTMVSNFRYLNIFKPLICEEVAYALERQDNDLIWNESYIFDLTPEKILLSLNADLAEAIKNIHYFGNQIVNSNLIVLGIKRLLLTGKIDEFNPNYYITLAQNQAEDTVVQFKNTQSNLTSERVGLGVIAEDAIAAQATRNNDDLKELLKRQKRLNTDIEANFTIQTLDGTDLRFDLEDAGTQFVEVDSEDKHVLIGDGDGYYVVVRSVAEEDKALVLDTKVSSTYYSPPDVRYNAMTLFKEDPSIYLTVVSNQINEFDTEYNMSSVPDIMVFGINLSTIETVPSDNPLVDITKATYKKLTQSEIEYYTLNYGLSITRANINYDDPFLYYARDVSTITLQQSDITFRSFDRNRTIVGENILSRNIPFGLILTPGCGSHHNPFAGFSKIDSYDGSTVTRTIRFIPDVNVNDIRVTSPPLEFNKLYTTQNKTSIGLIEETSFESAVFTYNPNSYIFNDRFYKDGFKQSITNNKDFGYSNFVKKINLLKESYDIDELTWWDIFRRLNFTEISRFIYDNNPEVTVDITAGMLGPSIRRVLARLDPNETTLLIPTESLTEDKIVLERRDR